ncbi:PIN-like domain-containing protein [Larkinella sp.]|uniref:PIN-like domain-containing protein n=1 Tax=Larkinella sp. TaxID=2034517 RepID=UPI003BAC246E
MPADRQEAFFNECIFVFDTSALLDFYVYPSKTNEVIFREVFDKIKGRLWIASHTEYEYLNNRLNTLKKPISRFYYPLLSKELAEVKKNLIEAKTKLIEIQEDTRNSDEHPYLEQDEINDFIPKLDQLNKDYRDFFNKIKIRIESKIQEIKEFENDDPVLKEFDIHFNVGRKYTFQELYSISQEGKFRYELKIPPGYEDLMDKKGLQAFGDLFIWKQIVELATELKKPIAFICNDLKSDWCILEENKKRIKSPREELIREMYDIANVSFWMYNQQQFLHLSKQYLQTQIDDEEIIKVGQLTLFGVPPVFYRNPNELVFECKSCLKEGRIDADDLFLEFEYNVVDEEMIDGEVLHTAYASFECENCGNEIDGHFEVYEYPIGEKESQSINLKGATVLQECYLDDYIEYSDATNEEDLLEEEYYEKLQKGETIDNENHKIVMETEDDALLPES